MYKPTVSVSPIASNGCSVNMNGKVFTLGLEIGSGLDNLITGKRKLMVINLVNDPSTMNYIEALQRQQYVPTGRVTITRGTFLFERHKS